MIYRIINESLIEQFPLWIEKNGIVYTNAAAEAIAEGWYPLEIQPVPEFDEETEYLIKKYALVDNKIILNWEKHQKTIGTDEDTDR